MASFTPASGVWTEDYDEFGNVVRRNQDARQVHHMMNNMPGRLPPPPSALSPRETFVPETRYPHFPRQLPPPPPASSPRGTFVPEAHRPQFSPGPGFTSSARPPAGFPPLSQQQGDMASFTPASDVWTKGYDQAGNICWYNKKVDEVHHHYYFYYDSPGYPPTLPPMGAPVKIIPYPHLPAGPWVTPAARASSEMFTPQGLWERAHTSHNCAALKDEKSPDGKDRTALAKTDTGHLSPFPPNNATHPAARTRSPPPKDSGPLPPFSPNNVTRLAARSKSPPPKDSGYLPPFPPNNAERPAARSKSPPPKDSETLPPFSPNNDTRPATRTGSPPPKDSGSLPSFPPDNATRPAARSTSPPSNDSGTLPPFPPNNFTRPVGLTWSPPSKESGPLPPFPPNNFTRPAARSRSPPPPREAPNNATDDRRSLQCNETGEEFYLNTTTFDWQIETPECLKKYKTI